MRCGRSLYQRAQSRAVGHVDDVRAMRDLLRGCVGVTIHRDDFDAKPLQLDDHFLAELARAQQHDLGGRGRKGCADAHEEAPELKCRMRSMPKERVSVDARFVAAAP